MLIRNFDKVTKTKVLGEVKIESEAHICIRLKFLGRNVNKKSEGNDMVS